MVERVSGVSKSASTVLVACKLPNGLVLQNYAMVERDEMTPQGPRRVPAAVKDGNPITVKGTALKFGQIPDFQMSNGYALTPVPADHWEKWLHSNKDSDVVKNRLVFAASDVHSVADMTKEARNAKVKSGMEPIDPKHPPSVGGGIKVVPTAVGGMS